eukprot:753024-Hanusia_phi.AAC.1
MGAAWHRRGERKMLKADAYGGRQGKENEVDDSASWTRAINHRIQWHAIILNCSQCCAEAEPNDRKRFTERVRDLCGELGHDCKTK